LNLARSAEPDNSTLRDQLTQGGFMKRTPQAAGNWHGGRGWARLQLFGAALLFGLLAVLTRITTLGGFNAGQIAVIRFAVGASISLALFATNPRLFAPVNRRLLFTRGALGGLAAFLYFVALSRIPAGEATLINNSFPILATAMAFFSRTERPTLHLVLGLLVASVGMFLVLGGGTSRFTLGWGELAGFLSALLGAGAVTAIRALRSTDNALTIFFAFCLGGLTVSWPFAWSSWPPHLTLWCIAILGVGGTSFGAQVLMTHAYGELTVPEAAIWQQLTPVASYLWALLLLDERLSTLGVAGVALSVAGIVYGSVFGKRRAAPILPRSAGANA
jgi:drug/metabolite transporter (DMT)-like permease